MLDQATRSVCVEWRKNDIPGPLGQPGPLSAGLDGQDAPSPARTPEATTCREDFAVLDFVNEEDAARLAIANDAGGQEAEVVPAIDVQHSVSQALCVERLSDGSCLSRAGIAVKHEQQRIIYVLAGSLLD